MTSYNSQCAMCQHFEGHEDNRSYCRAFRSGDGIPDDILFNKVDHRQPIEGDNGIQFDARNGVTHPFENE